MGCISHSCQLLANSERKISLTSSSSGIQHAWHFGYALVSVLKCNAVTSVLRASPLNWALVAMRKNAAKSQNLAVKAQSKVVFSRSNPVLDISAKTQIWHYRTADLFFGVADFRLDGRSYFAETQLGEFTVSKSNLLAERSLSLVW